MSDVNEMPVPTLVFGEVLEEEKLPVNVEPKQELQEKLDDSILSDEERKMVDEFSKQIDLHNSNAILQFGVGTQKKMADFSGAALENVRTKDLGEIGEMLSGVVAELKDFDEEETKGVFGFFKKTSNKLDAMKIKYSKAETNITQICQALEQQQVTLLKDIAVLDKMYDQNLAYFKELSMYILAGKKKLQDTRERELPALVEKARASGLPEDAQAAKDLEGLCDRFEKKIQMVLALGVTHAEQAARAQREVSDMTNELLRKNAAILKTAAVESAKESERGIVDIETLKNTNASLISTLDEVMKIQAEGRERRRAAETEMQHMEDELKQKLLEISGRKA